MAGPVRGLASMATRALLTELSEALHRARGVSVQFEAAGGVQVAKDIRAGAQADLAILSRAVMADLDADGLLEPGSLRPLFMSDVVAAVPDSAVPTPLSTEDDLRAALLNATRIAYSTGPSGTAIVDLIDRAQLGEAVTHRLVQAPPGTPVGSLLAAGSADLGFQQRSELADYAGVRVLGPLPGAAAIRSTFSGAILAHATNHRLAAEVLDFFGSADAEPYIAAAAMTAAQ